MTAISGRSCRRTLLSSIRRQPAGSRSSRRERLDSGQRAKPRADGFPRAKRVRRIIAASPLPRGKRGADVLLILLALPVVILLVLALYGWVKRVSPGNFVFRQCRIGHGGQPFTMYKIRTMKPDAAGSIHDAHVDRLIRTRQPMKKLDLIGDTRLIKGGWIIRMSGLDELPQLINVLRGEMSLVGPRPCLPNEFPLYDADQCIRFAVQPGLTGIWQVDRTDTTTFSEMAGMDVAYVERLSPWSDLKIILKTPVALFRQIAGCARCRVRNAAMRPFVPSALSLSAARK